MLRLAGDTLPQCGCSKLSLQCLSMDRQKPCINWFGMAHATGSQSGCTCHFFGVHALHAACMQTTLIIPMCVGQVAGDANASGHVYPDQSLYPANSVPILVKRLNQALQRADQIEFAEGNVKHDWYVHTHTLASHNGASPPALISIHAPHAQILWTCQQGG